MEKNPVRHAVSFLCLIVALLLPVAVSAQAQQDGTGSLWQVGVHGIWRGIPIDSYSPRGIGVAVERTIDEQLELWGTFQRYEPHRACLPELPGPCFTDGWTAYTGIDLGFGDRRGLVPYLALAAGVMRWDNGEFDAMWIVRPGLSYVESLVRPQVELGWERHLPWGLLVGLEIGL